MNKINKIQVDPISNAIQDQTKQQSLDLLCVVELASLQVFSPIGGILTTTTFAYLINLKLIGSCNIISCLTAAQDTKYKMYRFS